MQTTTAKEFKGGIRSFLDLNPKFRLHSKCQIFYNFATLHNHSSREINKHT